MSALGEGEEGAAMAEGGKRPRRHDGADDERIRAAAIEAARLLIDRHFENVLLLDVRALSEVTDWILIASGTSDRQIKATGGEVEDVVQEHGLRRFGRELDGPSTWLVLDFVDLMVHLFEPGARAHYDLEMLWGDAPQVSWRR